MSYLTFGKSISLLINFPLCASEPVAREYKGKKELTSVKCSVVLVDTLAVWKCKLFIFRSSGLAVFVCFLLLFCFIHIYSIAFLSLIN